MALALTGWLLSYIAACAAPGSAAAAAPSAAPSASLPMSEKETAELVRLAVLQDDQGRAPADLGASDHEGSVGRLAPEVIQRVVRASYGVIRKCYEAGLARNINLQGRVSTRFVIERDGNVRLSALASTTLQDLEVVKCVVAAFRLIHFPEPDGGIVTVVYPVMLLPG